MTSFRVNGVSKGFSLLELLVTISVIVILIGLSFPVYSRFKTKANQATCISHMRALHGAFAAAIQDQGHWPQVPIEDEQLKDENDFYEWWVKEMQKYGAAKETWRCPADKEAIRAEQMSGREFFAGSYVPSVFDDTPNSPFRYNQPWVVERGGNHGRGRHILMPDGSVSSEVNPFPGR